MLCSTNYYGNNTNILILQVNVIVSCLVLFNVRIFVLIQYQYNIQQLLNIHMILIISYNKSCYKSV